MLMRGQIGTFCFRGDSGCTKLESSRGQIGTFCISGAFGHFDCMKLEILKGLIGTLWTLVPLEILVALSWKIQASWLKQRIAWMDLVEMVDSSRLLLDVFKFHDWQGKLHLAETGVEILFTCMTKI